MKLNYKRTVLVGLAFMSICAFWQMYEGTIQLMLKNTFELGDTLIGAIMAADNVLALFLLPLFGTLSDRTKTRIGRRMPYILVGTSLASFSMIFIPIANSSKSLVLYFIVLGVVLIAMSTYRSPAVALMPDLTPKQLRSKANAIINLMGTVGGIVTLVLTKLFSPTASGTYLPLYFATAVFMMISVLALFLTVKEQKIAREMGIYDVDEAPKDVKSHTKLAPDVKKSLLFLLLSIVFWFFAYNAVSSTFSRYTQQVWGDMNDNYALYLMAGTIAATLSYIPIGILSSKLGRKKVILGGIVIMGTAFSLGAMFTTVSPLAYVMFGCVGIGWAAINVNSYPMVVEMSDGADVGKYTGIYYAFSMGAQVVTPIISGAIIEYTSWGYRSLFPYAAIFSALALITMLFVKHGDSKPEVIKDKLQYLD